MKKMLLTLASTAAVAAPIATVVACGNDGDAGVNYETIHVALDENLESIFDAALEEMSESDLDGYKIEFVALDDDNVIGYLDTVSSRGKDAASIFSLPADRYSGLVEQKLVAQNTYTGNGSGLVTVSGKTYGVPMNTESVFQIYNTDAAITNIDGYLTDLSGGVNGDNFITQFGNLWHGSTIMNAAVTASASDDTYDPENWVSQDSSGDWISPALETTEFEKGLTDLYGYYDLLHGSSDADYQNVAANESRDAVIRAGIADGTITHTIDGPWVINDIIARTLSGADASKDAEATAALDLLQKLKAEELPQYNGEAMRHFKGGWGFAMNAPRIDAVKDSDAYQGVMETFLGKLTDAKLATDWFTLAGKLPVNGNIAITETIVEGMEVSDPTSTSDAKIAFADWKDVKTSDDKTFASVLSDLYSSVSTAVTAQDANNVVQPGGSGWNFWAQFDDEGLSNAANFAEGKGAADFVSKFQTGMKGVFNELNAA